MTDKDVLLKMIKDQCAAPDFKRAEEDFKHSIKILGDTESGLSNELALKDASIENLTVEIERLGAEIERQRGLIEHQSAAVAYLEVERDELKSKLDDASASVERLTPENSKLRNGLIVRLISLARRGALRLLRPSQK